MKKQTIDYYFNCFIFMLIIAIILCSGCSKNTLTREKAKQLIIEKYALPYHVCGIWWFDSELHDRDINKYRFFRQKGWVAIEKHGEANVVSFTNEGKKIFSKEIANKIGFQGDQEYGLIIGEIVVSKVTGIKTSGDGTSAEVNYTLIVVPNEIGINIRPLSPIGRGLLNNDLTDSISEKKMWQWFEGKWYSLLQQKKAKFSLYDDGWRIEE